jgi:hypothetical protein
MRCFRRLPFFAVLALIAAGLAMWFGHRAAGPSLVVEATSTHSNRTATASITHSISDPTSATDPTDDLATVLECLRLLFQSPEKDNLAAKLAPLLARVPWEQFPQVLALAEALTFHDEPSRVWEVLIPHWATHDPAAAFTYSLAKHDRALGAEGAMRVWFDREPAGAQRHITALPSRDERHTQTRYLTTQQLAHDQDAALAWAAALPDATMRASALQQITWMMTTDQGGVDPAKVVATLSKIAADPAANDAFALYINLGVSSDPQATATWIGSLPAKENQAALLSMVLQEWCCDDEPAAAQWLESMPRTAVIDGLYAEFANRFIHTNGKVAIEWARAVKNPTLRKRSLEQLVARWQAFDADAASTWLASHPTESW